MQEAAAPSQPKPKMSGQGKTFLVSTVYMAGKEQWRGQGITSLWTFSREGGVDRQKC